MSLSLKKLLVLLLLLIPTISYAQFNYKIWMAFDTTANFLTLGKSDTLLKKPIYNPYNLCIIKNSFCDPRSGALRYIANGNLYLRNDSMIPVSYRLNPSKHYLLIDTGNWFYTPNNSYVQPLPMFEAKNSYVLAVPRSADTQLYAIGQSNYDSTLHYAKVFIGKVGDVPIAEKIDMGLDGSVITGSISIAMHQNGHDFWVIAHQTNSDTMLAYLFDHNGYAQVVKSSIGPKMGWSSLRVGNTAYHDYVYGDLSCSPDSKKVALLYNKWLWRNYNLPQTAPSYYRCNICLYDFDNATGHFTNCVVDTNRSGIDYILRAATFSSNSSKLYILSKTVNANNTRYWEQNLLQYDLDSMQMNRLPLPYKVATDSFVYYSTFGGVSLTWAYQKHWRFPTDLELGLNGRIYGDNQDDSIRPVILYPNLAGAACQFKYNGFKLKMIRNLTYTPWLPPFASRYIDTNYLAICPGKTVSFNNHVYNTAGIYYDTLPNYLNYDSVIINKVTMRSNSWQVIQGAACSNHGYYFNGQHLYQSGIYLDTLLNSLGCDSIAELHLAISTIPANTVSVQDSTLTASAMNCSYQWYECISGPGGSITKNLIPGATLQSYTVPHSGSYSVSIGVDSCISSSECFSVTRLSTGLLSLNAAAIKLLTFDHAAETHWVLQASSAVAIDHYLLVNALGQTIQEQANTSLPLRIDASNLAEGIYYLTIHTKGGIQTFKLKH